MYGFYNLVLLKCYLLTGCKVKRKINTATIHLGNANKLYTFSPHCNLTEEYFFLAARENTINKAMIPASK